MLDLVAAIVRFLGSGRNIALGAIYLGIVLVGLYTVWRGLRGIREQSMRFGSLRRSSTRMYTVRGVAAQVCGTICVIAGLTLMISTVMSVILSSGVELSSSSSTILACGFLGGILLYVFASGIASARGD